MSNELLNQVRDAISTTLKVPPEAVAEGATQDEIAAWDSVGHINLMMTLEQMFDIQMEPEDFERLTSVPAIVEYLKGRAA